MAILLNNDELSAMRGLPHAAICLYLAIRQTMDMATGMCGIRSMICWRGLSESLYIEPCQSRQESGSIHIETVRRLAALLEREGLINNSSKSMQRQLIFKCIHATCDKSVQKQADRQADRPTIADKPITARVLKFKKPEADRQADIHPSLDLYLNKSSSTEAPKIDDDDNFTKSEEQTKPASNNHPLTFPPRSEDWQIERMRSALKDIPRQDAQMILDELSARMRLGTVERPLGYFGRILQNYLKGDFVGELAKGEQLIRSQREAAQAARIEEQSKPAYQRNDAAFEETRAKLLELGILKRKKPDEIRT